MKNQIPKYILDALDKRQKYAEEFLKYDLIISNYCLKNNIDTEELMYIMDYFNTINYFH
jgi:hypothetical protein